MILQKTYLINRTSKGFEYNAGNKAVNDVTSILCKNGVKVIDVEIAQPRFTCRNIFSIISSCSKVPNSSYVFIQYPFIPNALLCILISLFLKLKACKIILIVHDINSYRYNQIISKGEKMRLNLANYLIVHSQQMASLLKNESVKTPSSILEVFDYILEKFNDEKNPTKGTILFAGNLQKSIFLNKWTPNPNLRILLYGLPFEGMAFYENFNYKGKFSPSDVSMLDSQWGLVWDGDETDTCSGSLGNYLRINAPHKASLYLASQIPIIVWKESAIYSYVKKKNLGVGINSLDEITDAINNISDEDYHNIKRNVIALSFDIRKGNMLMNVIKDIKL